MMVKFILPWMQVRTGKRLVQNIKEMPAGAWVSQIKLSPFTEGEAFVVVNNYRQGDYSAYLFKTS